MSNKMGYQGKLYYGVAGSTASTLITRVRDVTYNTEPEKGDTTVRGDGSAPPVGSEAVTRLNPTITWTMIHNSSDTALAALLAAAFAGTPIALRTKDYAAGKGFDGDVTLSVNHSEPIGGEQTYEFTATPENSLREANLYV